MCTSFAGNVHCEDTIRAVSESRCGANHRVGPNRIGNVFDMIHVLCIFVQYQHPSIVRQSRVS